MPKALEYIANLAAILGVVLCAVSGVARLAGSYHVASYEAMTLFNAGVGSMVFAALVKVEVLLRRCPLG